MDDNPHTLDELPIPFSLEQVKQRFESWRQRRKKAYPHFLIQWRRISPSGSGSGPDDGGAVAHGKAQSTHPETADESLDLYSGTAVEDKESIEPAWERSMKQVTDIASGKFTHIENLIDKAPIEVYGLDPLF